MAGGRGPVEFALGGRPAARVGVFCRARARRDDAPRNGGRVRVGKMVGLRSFLTWWLAELSALVPRAPLRALGLLPPVLTLECRGGTLAVSFRRGGRGARSESVAFGESGPAPLRETVSRLLGGVAPGNVFVELVIDRDRALERTVRVPRAAAREIAGVVSFEIERHTPYRADEVVYDWTLDPAAVDGQTLAVDLVMAPRQIVGQLVAAAAQAGLTPDAIRVATGATSRRDLPLAAAGVAPAPTGGAPRLLAVAALLLGLAATGAPFARQYQVTSGLETAVEQAKTRAVTAARQGGDVARRRDALHAIIAAKQAAPAVTRIFDRLSAILPDGTWLHHVSVVDGEVVVEGLTDRSTRLVKLLEASPLFEQVRYNAPVTRERGGRTERFSFVLKLSGGGGT